MSQQMIVKRGSGLKRIGMGLVSAGILTAATACSVALPPAPVAAPAPAAVEAPAVGTNAPPTQAHSLEMFRYIGRPAAIESQSASRSLEFYRYADLPGVAVTLSGSTRPMEIIRYTTASIDTTGVQQAQQPLETFRYAPASTETTGAQATPQPLEIFRHTDQPRTRPSLPR
jgi:hypothetical protein